MAAEAESDESLAAEGPEKKGIHMRRGSDATKRYQSGARKSALDMKDKVLDVMDKLGGLTQSLGAVAHSRAVRYIMGFITDEAIAAGFALAGVLETGHRGKPSRVHETKNRKASGPNDGATHAVITRNLVGRKNYFVVNRDTSQDELERAFKVLTKRSDMAVLVINADIIERLQAPIERHDAKATLPIIVPLPVDDDPYKCIEDKALDRPENFGFLTFNDPLQIFHQVEAEFEHSLYHFHNISHDNDKHAHQQHANQGHNY